jgi:hypothetical protein
VTDDRQVTVGHELRLRFGNQRNYKQVNKNG